MIQNERDSRHEQVLWAARQMMTAARTAPKAKGVDIVEVALVSDEELTALAQRMKELAVEQKRPSFERDGGNLLQAECVILIGTRELAMGLNCGHCGSATCGARAEGVPCAFNVIDVGIAIGSACAMAADLRVDTRVMYSAGLVAMQMGYLKGCHSVIAIPVSASSKNPFFDRQPK